MRPTMSVVFTLAWISLLLHLTLAAPPGGPVSEYGAPTSQFSGTGFCETIIAPYGSQYNCTEHTVLAYNYLITLQRIWRIDLHPSKSIDSSTPPTNATLLDVFFLHTTFAGGDIWFVANNPIPLALADNGYIVWIGNERASKFTFGHEYLNPTQFEYWNWDGDELANYDWPALTTFIYQYNGGRKFHFVGFSQGARVGIGAASYQGNDYFASFTLLAPVVYVAHTVAPLLQSIRASNLGYIAYRAQVPQMCLNCFGGSVANLPNTTAVKAIGLETLTGPNCCIDYDKVYDLFTGPHSCTTTKTLSHLTQSMNLQNFQAYDYGTPNENMMVYQSYVPPYYTLGNVNPNIRTFVFYGGNDEFATPEDVNYFMSQLPVPPKSLLIPNYAHADFVFSKFLNRDINPNILDFLAAG